jgi:hypothetical protein
MSDGTCSWAFSRRNSRSSGPVFGGCGAGCSRKRTGAPLPSPRLGAPLGPSSSPDAHASAPWCVNTTFRLPSRLAVSHVEVVRQLVANSQSCSARAVDAVPSGRPPAARRYQRPGSVIRPPSEGPPDAAVGDSAGPTHRGAPRPAGGSSAARALAPPVDPRDRARARGVTASGWVCALGPPLGQGAAAQPNHYVVAEAGHPVLTVPSLGQDFHRAISRKCPVRAENSDRRQFCSRASWLRTRSASSVARRSLPAEQLNRGSGTPPAAAAADIAEEDRAAGCEDANRPPAPADNRCWEVLHHGRQDRRVNEPGSIQVTSSARRATRRAAASRDLPCRSLDRCSSRNR